jgi:hypothetical protein
MFTRFLSAIAIAVALCVTPILASSSGKSSNGTAKPVHVKGSTKKDGTKVKAHDRKAPKEHATKPPKTPKDSASKATAANGSVAHDEKRRIQRSAAARHAFARQTGYPNGRPGYVIDHIVPLACGGSDTPSNMQWQTVAAAKAKDKTERAGCR